MPARLPEEESISRIRQAFSEVHVHLKSDPIEDLEAIRSGYTQFRKKVDLKYCSKILLIPLQYLAVSCCISGDFC